LPTGNLFGNEPGNVKECLASKKFDEYFSAWSENCEEPIAEKTLHASRGEPVSVYIEVLTMVIA
jgi:hypothetical protein